MKQRTGCLTYQEDPTRLITSQMNAFSQPNHSRWHFEPLNLLQLVDQPDVINTTRTLLLQPDRPALRWPIEPAGHSDELRHSVLLYARLVADSVMGDRLHGLPILLGLTQVQPRKSDAQSCSSLLILLFFSFAQPDIARR